MEREARIGGEETREEMREEERRKASEVSVVADPMVREGGYRGGDYGGGAGGPRYGADDAQAHRGRRGVASGKTAL